MFESLHQNKSLDEDLFENWLEQGRESLLGYHYLLVIWNDLEAEYQPIYLSSRAELSDYKGSQAEVPVAAYDLYSESRVQ